MALYRNLLRADGSVDLGVFNAIAESTIRAEVNLALCVRARRFIPDHVPVGDACAWRAEQAAELDPTLLPAAERADIADREREHLGHLVQAMRDAQLHVEDQISKGVWK